MSCLRRLQKAKLTHDDQESARTAIDRTAKPWRSLRREVPAARPSCKTEMRVFSHIVVGSNDIRRSQLFYDAVLGAIGAKPARTNDKNQLVYVHKGCIFLVTAPVNGQPATGANGGTIGFSCETPAQVDNVHAAGVAQGGTSCEDPPGIRDGSFGKLYLAYLRDPDGNKLCALHQMA
jgi:catechol 2,3-dioxygenase-like lactoylglutathione lyase family enzyme